MFKVKPNFWKWISWISWILWILWISLSLSSLLCLEGFAHYTGTCILIYIFVYLYFYI